MYLTSLVISDSSLFGWSKIAFISISCSSSVKATESFGCPIFLGFTSGVERYFATILLTKWLDLQRILAISLTKWAKNTLTQTIHQRRSSLKACDRVENYYQLVANCYSISQNYLEWETN